MASWFGQNQCCPDCGSRHAEVFYATDYSRLNERLQDQPSSFWHYFDFLPLEKKENIVSFGEGAIALEEWDFLNRYAADHYHVRCRVYAYRNDRNEGTHSLKDVAASMTASVLKECGIRQFCVASTGNTATANARYLNKAGIRFTNFGPSTMNQDTVDEIRSYGQEAILSAGDYAQAKQEAAAFAEKQHTPISIGNIDPLRVESKRTMVFEFMRQLGKMPDVYIQAVGGGTGPIALDKGYREMEAHKTQICPENEKAIKLPRMLLVQQDLCDPMVRAWEKAKNEGFPENFENDYPILDNPPTAIFILSAGNPGMYPLVARIVQKSDGDFLRIQEAGLPDFARIVYNEKKILIGPAAVVCFAGFYQALKENKIKDGETIVINIGESGRRYPDFVSQWMP
jgi:threonine synthase